MIKQHIKYRKATPEELKSGSNEMVIESIEEYEVDDEIIASVAFKEFVKMTDDELSFVASVLKDKMNASSNTRSANFEIDENGEIKIKKSLWQRFLEWLKR